MKRIFTLLAVTLPVHILANLSAYAADKVHSGSHETVHHAVEQSGEHASAGLPQLDPSSYPSQIFWLFVTFVFLYILFSKKVLPDISATLDKRRERIEEDLNSAESLKQKAEDVHKAYDEALMEAREQASETFSKTETEIKKNNSQAIAEMNDQVLKKIESMEKTTIKAKEKVLKEIDDVAAVIASDIVKKIIGISTDPKTAQAVIKKINKEAA